MCNLRVQLLPKDNFENTCWISSWEKRPFKCDICHHSCSQKGDLKKHIESVHEKKKPFKCDICEKTFNRKDNMATHVSKVHEGTNPSSKLTIQ